MLLHGAELAEGAVLRSRAAVVGAGPAGLALAHELAGAGVDVLLLEAADAATPPGDLESVADVGLAYRVSTKRHRGVGGGALAWNIRTPLGAPYVRLRELDELDLVRRPGVREESWPIPRAALDEPYRRAWALYGVTAPRDLPGGGDAPVGDGDLVARTFGFGPAAAFTERLPRALAAHPRARLVDGVVVTDVRTDTDAGTVSSLAATTSAGARITVEAEVVVLAAGGIEVPRLLLASRSRRPEGLGNASDHVGRHFMEHPHYDAALLRPADHRLDDAPDRWDVHALGGTPVQTKLALSPAALEREGLLAADHFVVPRSPGRLVVTGRGGGLHASRTAALATWRGALGRRRPPAHPAATALGALAAAPSAARYAARQALAERAVRAGHPHAAPPRALTLRAMAEQLPHPDSRVRLDGGTDRHGLATAVLDWRMAEADWESLLRTQRLVAPLVGRALGVRVDPMSAVEARPWVTGGAHQMGTARMAASPRDGVVDADGLVHGTRNLYVVGSAVFPTSGSANPTLTIVALALRLADHLRGALAAPAAVGGAAVGGAAVGDAAVSPAGRPGAGRAGGPQGPRPAG